MQDFNRENEIRRYYKKKYGIDCDSSRMSFDVAKAIAEETDLVLSSMIGRTQSLKAIEGITKDDREGQYDRITKTIGIRLGKTREDLLKQAKKQYEDGYWSTGDWRHTIRHELGHVVIDHMSLWSDFPKRIEKIKEICENGEEHLSKYANDRKKSNWPSEAIAESFAAFLNGTQSEIDNDILQTLFGRK